jgi:hypothetical protein
VWRLVVDTGRPAPGDVCDVAAEEAGGAVGSLAPPHPAPSLRLAPRAAVVCEAVPPGAIGEPSGPPPTWSYVSLDE